MFNFFKNNLNSLYYIDIMTQVHKDIAYLKLLLGSTKISKREEIEIQYELETLEKKKKAEEAKLALLKLGVSLYGSYFDADIKIE